MLSIIDFISYNFKANKVVNLFFINQIVLELPWKPFINQSLSIIYSEKKNHLCVGTSAIAPFGV